MLGTEESFTRFTSLVYEGREFMNGALLSTESTEFLFQKEAPNSLFFRGVQGIMGLDYYFDWRNSEYYRMDQVLLTVEVHYGRTLVMMLW